MHSTRDSDKEKIENGDDESIVDRRAEVGRGPKQNLSAPAIVAEHLRERWWLKQHGSGQQHPDFFREARPQPRRNHSKFPTHHE